MANITVTTAATFIPEIWSPLVKRATESNLTMARLVVRDFEGEIKQKGDTVYVGDISNLSTGDKTASTNVTYEAITESNTTITINKHKLFVLSKSGELRGSLTTNPQPSPEKWEGSETTDNNSRKWMRGLITGMILGDGNFLKQKTCRNVSVMINHSLKQKEYLLWKKDILQKLFSSPISVLERKVFLKRTGKTYPVIMLRTKVHSRFKFIWKRTYKDFKKNIRKETLDMLNIGGLAIWFMDDGSIDYNHRRVLLSTCCSYDEAELVCDFLKNKYDLTFHPYRQRDELWCVICGIREGRKMARLLRPFFHKSMMYKLEILLSDSATHFTRNDDIVQYN